jgi:3-oxoacyl-[acyl-carrier protein] reductase
MSGAALHDRVALVTGASRGIGRAIALALAKAGADVVINYRERTNEAEAVAEDIHSLGRRALVVQADVSRSTDLDRLVETARAHFRHIDILVNNAGITRVQPMDEITEQDWDDLMTVNVKSCFLLIRAVVPAMRDRQWGRIINLSSVAAQVGGIVGPHYAASKAALLGMTHFYASRLARDGVTVNAIAPALIETEMVTSNPNATAKLIPVGRFGQSEEVADVAVMLAANGYITGQTININGGWYLA